MRTHRARAEATRKAVNSRSNLHTETQEKAPLSNDSVTITCPACQRPFTPRASAAGAARDAGSLHGAGADNKAPP